MSLQGLLFEPESNWRPPTEFPRLWEAKRVAIDFETKDPDLKRHGPGWGRTQDKGICGIGVATEDRKWYFPIRHLGGGNMPEQGVLRWFKRVAEAQSEKLLFNALYEMGWAAQEGIQIKGRLLDASTAVPLIDENRGRGNYNLDSVSSDWLGQGKSEDQLRHAAKAFGVDKKRELWKLHSKYVGVYGEDDAALHFDLWDECEQRLDQQDLWEAYELEAALLPHLMQMRMRGIRVDLDAAEQLRGKMLAKRQEIRDWCQAKLGVELQERANESIARSCETLGLDYRTTDKGNPSFEKDWLKAQDHLFFKAVVAARASATLASLLEGQVLNGHVNGRIHCQLHPLASDEGGTITYRFSSSHPNLQQVPIRNKDWGKLYRALFLPEEGERWIKADYSQQEYRLIVHYATLLRCAGAAEAAAQYRADPKTDFHQMVAELLGIPDNRSRAKDMNFGMAYSMGAEALAEYMGISIALAEEYLDQYHARVPFVRELSHACSNRADRQGTVRLLGGHLCHFPFWEPNTRGRSKDDNVVPLRREEAEAEWPRQGLRRAYTYKALNKLIQGGCAGMTKRALVDIAEAGLLPLLQVHDELDFSTADPQRDAPMIKEVMEDAFHGEVPFACDTEVGPNWGELEKAA